MRAFLRRFLCLPKTPKQKRRSYSSSQRMSSSATAAVLYAATVSPASITGGEPEDAREKLHHLGGGKGFTNPWVSILLQAIVTRSISLLCLTVGELESNERSSHHEDLACVSRHRELF